ncbi:MAG: DUF3783 domain-containing protein [Calditerrivibrio sp.]|nr:DUF3783 domain-containing protein [Calditerrivibrio sp.]MCA1932706.1 DUF3783 domain-containing protein [Calditerrivibrio sp.]
MDNRLLIVGGFDEKELSVLIGFDNFSVKILHREDTDYILKDFINAESAAVSPLEIKVILFHNFNKEQIFDFINFYKSLGMARPIFAMVTQHSIEWKIKDLIYHLLQEEKEVKASK